MVTNDSRGTVGNRFERSAMAAVLRHRVVRNSFVYTGSGLIRNAIPFLLLPVLTRYLSPEDFGIVASFEVALAMLLVIVGLNMHGAIAVNFFKMERREIELYTGNVILVSMLAGVVALVVTGLLTRMPWPDLGGGMAWLPLVAAAALSQVFLSIALTLWQVEQKALSYGLFQTLHTVLNVTLSLLFVVALSWGWRGRLLGIVVASVAFGTLSLVVVRRSWYRGFTLRRDYIRDALAFGVPLVPHALGNWAMIGVGRLLIAAMIGTAATGIYTVGYQVGMIVGLIATSFNQAWSPFLFEKLHQDDARAKRLIVKITYVYIVAILGLAVILTYVAPWLLNVFVGSEFRGAHEHVFWVALGYAANGMYLMVANYIFFAKKTHVIAWITAFSAVVNIVLSYVLIRANGAIGAAQASAASFFLSFVLTWILGARIYKMPWQVWKEDDDKFVEGVSSNVAGV